MSTPLQAIMSTDLQVTTPDAPVTETAAAMVAAGIGSALVMTGGTLVGIITERDVLRAAASGADLGQAAVQSWMTPDPVTVGPEVDVAQATEIMLTQGFRHLPVTIDREVCGMVSLRDLMSARVRRRI
jgi:CBS domain-containing protein